MSPDPGNMRHEESGEETILVDRPGFKPGGRRHALPGGFDSHSSPPLAHCVAAAQRRASAR
jgi:hypothetical protein